MRRLRIGANRRCLRPENTGFFKTDGLARRPEPIGVVKRYAGHHRAIGIVDIDRIQTPAQAHFEDQHLDPGGGKSLPRRQRAELEVGQRHVTRRLPCRFDLGEGGAQRFIVDRRLGNAHPLVVVEQMRRGIAADAIAGSGVNRLQISAGRPLAVGAADDDQGTALRLPQSRLDQRHPLKTQLDPALPLRMQTFEMNQPVRECFHKVLSIIVLKKRKELHHQATKNTKFHQENQCVIVGHSCCILGEIGDWVVCICR